MIGGSVRLAASLLLLATARAVPQAASSTSSSIPPVATSSGLPVVDLDYQLHQASFFNQSGGYYNFSNIRYAAPPVGNLRFAAPQAPATNRSTVNTGLVGHVCPQAGPAWQITAQQWIPQYLTGQPLNYSRPNAEQFGQLEVATADPRTTEDCLFLDMLVPKSAIDQAGQANFSGLPIMFWIYGGGYVQGDKSQYQAAGLLQRSNNSVIWIGINYRLGAFGWLSSRAGGKFQSQGGTPNAALYDQRFALEWVQKYAKRFGGDPNNVFIFGESAGGGSVEHQITAYGGANGSVPFQRALTQSPGWVPVVANAEQDAIFNEFLAYANATDLEALRNADSATLIRANTLQIANSSYGAFTYGPAVDDGFVPDLPGRLLAQGKFAKNLTVMVGHNKNEGLDFTNPATMSDAGFINQLTTILPQASNDTISYIANVLYPPVYTGAYGYKDNIQRADLVITEFIFTCNTFYLDLAYNNKTYAYIFDVPPALHGMDVAYTYYNGNGAPGGSVANATVAEAMQYWFTSFAKTGVPTAPGIVAGGVVPQFVQYGPNARVELLQATNISIAMDDAANSRCRWWQQAFYAPLVRSYNSNDH